MINHNGYYSEEQDEADRKSYYNQKLETQDITAKELNRLLNDTHTSWLPYRPSVYLYPNVDLHADGQLRSIYSNRAFSVEELSEADRQIDQERANQLKLLTKRLILPGQLAYDQLFKHVEALLPYNCEHVVCQSWFNSAMPMRGDLHHLFACETQCNSFRNNCPYTDLASYQPTMSSITEKDRFACGAVMEGLFEPENNKGIVARAVFYFQVRYPHSISVYGKNEMQVMKEWSDKQPVTLYEKHRNQAVFRLQGNRNPFIDFPSLSNFLSF